LPPDRIVEMCDELIAAHGLTKDGGVLPDLDAKRTLVPFSGKTFQRVDSRVLRSAWDSEQRRCQEQHITNWHVLGPFSGSSKGSISLDLQTPVGESQGVDLHAPVPLNGHFLTWKPAAAGVSGYVDLGAALGPAEWVVAYANTRIESAAARDAVLRCGSDDGIRIWLNGELVHSREIGRAYRPGDDEVAIRLRAGWNYLLVKVSNYQGMWGFGVRVSDI
jgi:hypothetical protein